MTTVHSQGSQVYNSPNYWPIIYASADAMSKFHKAANPSAIIDLIDTIKRLRLALKEAAKAAEQYIPPQYYPIVGQAQVCAAEQAANQTATAIESINWRVIGADDDEVDKA